MNAPRDRPDPPFTSDGEVEAMVAAFEHCNWPYERWTHRAHVGVATNYLMRMPYDAALARMRHHIGRYNRSCGDPKGYHETITVLFLRRLAAALAASPDRGGLAVTVETLAATFDMRWPLEYYSSARLWSPEARRAWVDPDLKPLDFWPVKLSSQ